MPLYPPRVPIRNLTLPQPHGYGRDTSVAFNACHGAAAQATIDRFPPALLMPQAPVGRIGH
jgi:hypothetical protein